MKRGLAVLAVAITAVLAFSQGASAAAGVHGNPQVPAGPAKTADVTPDQCTLMTQMNPDEQKYRLTYNAPVVYTTSTVGTNFFNVKCGLVTFTVPRGFDSLIDFTAAAELDCQAPTAAADAWCESRFLVNVVNVLPNNGGRGDTFAWDSTNGGSFDWQANTLDQVGHVVCPRSNDTSVPCTYHAQLQARLDNGASYLWVDDLTIRIDVSEGVVAVTSVTP
jgi:hypothetical protein